MATSQRSSTASASGEIDFHAFIRSTRVASTQLAYVPPSSSPRDDGELRMPYSDTLSFLDYPPPCSDTPTSMADKRTSMRSKRQILRSPSVANLFRSLKRSPASEPLLPLHARAAGVQSPTAGDEPRDEKLKWAGQARSRTRAALTSATFAPACDLAPDRANTASDRDDCAAHQRPAILTRDRIESAGSGKHDKEVEAMVVVVDAPCVSEQSIWLGSGIAETLEETFKDWEAKFGVSQSILDAVVFDEDASEGIATPSLTPNLGPSAYTSSTATDSSPSPHTPLRSEFSLDSSPGERMTALEAIRAFGSSALSLSSPDPLVPRHDCAQDASRFAEDGTSGAAPTRSVARSFTLGRVVGSVFSLNSAKDRADSAISPRDYDSVRRARVLLGGRRHTE